MNAATRELIVLAARFGSDAGDRERTVAAIRQAGEGGIEWPLLLAAAERHGVLLGVDRRLRDFGVEPEMAAGASWSARVAAVAADERRFRFSVQEFLGAAKLRKVTPVLLKGAALLGDLYDGRAVRSQGDVDVLVERRQVAAAVAAAADVGYGMPEARLPLWWYRRTHFHIGLEPLVPFMKPLEVHWALNSPALLLHVPIEALWERRRVVGGPFGNVTVLDPHDQFLHLVTHLWSHGFADLGASWPIVAQEMFEDPASELRLKWFVDIAAAADRMTEDDVTAVASRIRQWHAEAAGRAVFPLVIESGLACAAGVAALERMGATIAAAPASGAPADRAGRPTGGRTKNETLEFRPAALRRLPLWLWPPRDYVLHRYRGPRGTTASAVGVTLLRLRHLLTSMLRVVVAATLLPVALTGRRLSLATRRARRRQALEPDEALERVVRWRTFEARAARAAVHE